MGIFDALNAPGVRSGTAYFAEGKFLARLQSMSYKLSQDPKRPENTVVVIANFAIVESTRPDTEPGEVRGIVKVLEPPKRGAFGPDWSDVKALLLALTGCNPADMAAVSKAEAEITAKGGSVASLLEAACSEGNPLAGTQIRITATDKPTKSGGTFTTFVFAPYVKGAE